MLLLHDYTKILLPQRIIIIICMINFLTAEEDLTLINFLLTFSTCLIKRTSRGKAQFSPGKGFISMENLEEPVQMSV